jgi:hypothetical protein
MSSAPFHLSTVEDVVVITGRKPILLLPGIPRNLQSTVRAGDEIELRRPDGTSVSTVIAGIEHARMVDGNSRWPLRLPESIGAADVPVGTEIWCLPSEKP